ncbi:hypothetical protein DM01DRAFT_1394088 [Hesseltinella vesiculosa]|uniref:Uncharacterized protein n=1 Tax=Hesseltinella vesiculosa TaxID=101127 RepID=A0A1X2GBH4_9FUNG|nr:hypothetical protein DM01DRAFT_1394088 [Hesseltinella vesiculosa]
MFKFTALHGLDPNFKLSIEECQLLKLDLALGNMPAKAWKSLESLADAHIIAHGSTTNLADICKSYYRSFDILSKKRKTHLALKAYCGELSKRFRQKDVLQAFQTIYRARLLEFEKQQLLDTAKKIGYNNSLRLAIQGGDTLACELDSQGGQPHRPIPSTDDQSQPSTPFPDSPVDGNLPVEGDRVLLGSKRKYDDKGDDNKNDSDNDDKVKDHSGKEEDQVSMAIQTAALAIHQEFKDGKKINSQRRKTMSSGLSMAMDLIDLSHESQASLFEVEQLSAIIGHVQDECKVDSDLFSMPNDLINVWKEVVKLWVPLLESLFKDKLVTVSYGETTNAFSNQRKREQYCEPTALAFKIDARFVYHGDNLDVDLGAVEAAKDNECSKGHHDLGKLMREGKDVLDGLFFSMVGDDDVDKLSAWVIQLFGTQGQLASIHQTKKGLYFGVPRGDLILPTSIATMDRFIETLSSLIGMANHVQLNAMKIKTSIESMRLAQTSLR